MEIKCEYKTYFTRVLKRTIFNTIISILLLMLLFPAGLFLSLAVNIPLFLFGLLIDLHREKYYITSFVCDEKKVCIEYYKFNTFINETFSIKEFDLLYGSDFEVRASALALIFRKHRQKIVKQYQSGIWTKAKMVELYEYIRNEKLKNINK